MTPRDPGRYVHAGGIVVVPARIAAVLERYTDVGRLRVDRRGQDAELDAVLQALRFAAMGWKSSATGTSVATVAEPGSSSAWLSTTQAATQLHLGERAVRKAIAEQRLRAVRVGTRWRISREDLEQYRAARAV